MSKSAAAVKTEAAVTAPSRALKFETLETEHGHFRVGTIRHRIYEMLTLPKAKAMTKAEMLADLVSKFGDADHSAEQLNVTLGFSIWDFEKKLKKFTVGRDDAGRYSINIEGRSTARVGSADGEKTEKPAKAKKERKIKSKATPLGTKRPAKAKKGKTIRAGLREITE
jgi:hypothetical protein